MTATGETYHYDYDSTYTHDDNEYDMPHYAPSSASHAPTGMSLTSPDYSPAYGVYIPPPIYLERVNGERRSPGRRPRLPPSWHVFPRRFADSVAGYEYMSRIPPTSSGTCAVPKDSISSYHPLTTSSATIPRAPQQDRVWKHVRVRARIACHKCRRQFSPSLATCPSCAHVHLACPECRHDPVPAACPTTRRRRTGYSNTNASSAAASESERPARLL